MKNFYFTFGVGTTYASRYVVIAADTYEDARNEMFARFGTNWAFQYTEKEWVDEDGISMADDWNLTEMK